MANDLKTLRARLPGEWFVEEQFEQGGCRWEITEVLSMEQGYTKFEAHRLYPLGGGHSSG